MKLIVHLLVLAFVWESYDVHCEHIDAEKYEQQFATEFENYIRNDNVGSEKFLHLLQVIEQDTIVLDDIPNALNPKNCLICRAMSHSFLQSYRKFPVEQSNSILSELCRLLTPFSDHSCRGNVDIHMPVIKFILNERKENVTSDSICGIFLRHNRCSNDTENKLLDFTIDISDPVLRATNEILKNQSQHNGSVDTSSDVIVIAHLTDFHYDAHYEDGSSAECTDFVCCRNISLPKENATAKANKWGALHCDSPGIVVENICSVVADKHKNIDLIYYTGDFTDHFEWVASRDTVQESIKFVTDTVKRHFPDGIPVIMVLGNHDTHPSNAFAPSSVIDSSINSQWLYDFVADEWSNWLPQSALDTLRTGGYYTFIVRPRLRIVALNNNLCFTFNIWIHYGSDEMRVQLQWLHDTLQLAEEAGEFVHILGHVPPNTASCVYPWNREYDRIVRRFAHIITGQFFGHTHRDEFNVFYAEAGNSQSTAVNVAWNAGSGTTFVGFNSNYRLYYADNVDYRIVDHDTWIFNLTEANSHPDDSPKWFKEYSFKDAFDLPDLRPKTIGEMLQRWKGDTDQLKKYWVYKHKSSPFFSTKDCDADCLEVHRQEATCDIEANFF